MTRLIARRALLAVAGLALLAGGLSFGSPNSAAAADMPVLRFSTPASQTDFRSKGLEEIFGAAIKDFAKYEPHYNATLFKQGTELIAIQRGNLEMSITSAQELATLIPSWSIFTAGYLLRDADHQRKVFESDVGKEMYGLVEDQLGIKLLSVIYFGGRQLNLRTDKEIRVPEDLAGVKLRMPGTDAWLFLGKALGANPVPVAFTEVYTALQTGAIDGQDNPLPTSRDRKFYEVTKQVVLTNHLVDMNFLSISKEVWDKFTPAQQQVMQQAASDASAKIAKDILAQEAEIQAFFKEQGLKVYTPDLNAFRTRVQKMYLESEFAKDWPKGMVDRVNAIQ